MASGDQAIHEPRAAARTPIRPLAAAGLSWRAGEVEVLREVSLRIVAGTRNVVIGPNGAGKSVLLRMLHGLLVPSGGRLDSLLSKFRDAFKWFLYNAHSKTTVMGAISGREVPGQMLFWFAGLAMLDY